MVTWSFTPVYILSPVLNVWKFQVAILYFQIHEGIQLFRFLFVLFLFCHYRRTENQRPLSASSCVAPHLLHCGVGVSTALSIRVCLCCMLLWLQHDSVVVMMMFTCLSVLQGLLQLQHESVAVMMMFTCLCYRISCSCSMTVWQS